MTLGIAGYVTGLTYAAVDLQPSDRSIVLWIARGLNDVPSVRGQDIVVPHKTGQTASSRVADKLTIELDGWILANGATSAEITAAFRVAVAALQAAFDPVAGYQELAATLEDGSDATIDARVVILLIEERVPSHVAHVSVQLESIDPYWVLAAP